MKVPTRSCLANSSLIGNTGRMVVGVTVETEGEGDRDKHGAHYRKRRNI